MNPSHECADDPILRFQLGDKSAFAELVDGFHPRLTVFFYRHFWDQGLSEDLPKLTDVLLDMVCRPSFDPNEIERERVVILEEIAMYRDNPAQHVEDLLGEAAWPDTSLGRPITGEDQVSV